MASRKTALHVGRVLRRWLKRQQLDGQVDTYELKVRWVDLVSERIAARTEPRSLRDGLLTVAVANSAWLTELSFLRQQLIERINSGVGAARVRGIRFVIGSVPALQPAAGRAIPPPPDISADDRVHAEERACRDVPELVDDELRRRILRAHRAQLLRGQRR